MKAFLIALLFFLPLILSAQDDAMGAMEEDSASINTDTIAAITYDTAAIYASAHTAINNSVITNGEKPKWYDIEQQRKSEDNAWIFFILVQLLIILTILKLAFHNDFEHLFKIFGSPGSTAQITRSSKEGITLSSLLMSTIFITTMSVFTRFVLLHFYPYSILRNNFSILALIFLFTFFSLAKYMLLKYIGGVFEMNVIADEYIFILSAVTRTIGISMIPILFVLYASSEKYFDSVLIISLIILFAGAVMLITRGLSTSYKLMYSSMYHFLIYICCAEVLPIFLFIKLLTKTVI